MQIPHCLHPSDSLCSATRKDGLCAAPGILAPGATSGGLSCRLILGWVQAVCLAALARLQPTFPRILIFASQGIITNSNSEFPAPGLSLALGYLQPWLNNCLSFPSVR